MDLETLRAAVLLLYGANPVAVYDNSGSGGTVIPPSDNWVLRVGDERPAVSPEWIFCRHFIMQGGLGVGWNWSTDLAGSTIVGWRAW